MDFDEVSDDSNLSDLSDSNDSTTLSDSNDSKNIINKQDILEKYNKTTEEDDEDEEVDYKTKELEIGMEKNVEIWRMLLLLLLLYLGLYMFITFLPITFITPQISWLKYEEECCKMVHGEYRCSYDSYCAGLLHSWINIFNKSNTLINDCCYWYAPYDCWRSSPYCKIDCLK